MQLHIRVDADEYVRWAKKYAGKIWPAVVVRSIARVGVEGVAVGRREMRRTFHLHSNFVLEGAKSMPSTPSQIAASERALVRHGDFAGAVYIRGAETTKNSLDFIVHHEEGKTRSPQRKTIAIPTRTMQGRAFRNLRGSVKNQYKPSQLLKRFIEAKVPFNGKTTTGKGTQHARRPGRRRVGDAFLMRGRGSVVYIVRRLSGNKWDLEFLYTLYPKAKIKKRMAFIEAVTQDILNNGSQILVEDVRRLG
jgi:hypothetical protein